jgi:hypothetical protein
LLFRMVSRAGCSLHFLLRRVRAGYPYKLFLVLASHTYIAEILADPDCLYDDLAAAYLAHFSTFEAITSPAGMAVLVGLASLLSVDIAGVEARHASTRRITTLSSLQTWIASLEAVSADWCTRQFASISQSVFGETTKTAKTKPTKDKSVGKQTGSKGGGGELSKPSSMSAVRESSSRRNL